MRLSIFPFLRRYFKLRAVKVLLFSLALWLASFQYCRLRFWRDPHSAFFDDRHVYDLKYSLYRESEAWHFVSQHNSFAESQSPIKADYSPTLCASFVTVARGSGDYFSPSIGSLLEGLDPRERRALYLDVLFADTDPSKHPSWGQKWVTRLTDSTRTYNVSDDQFQHLQELEKDRNFYEKGVFDYTDALSSCQTSGAPYIIVFEDDIILAEGWMAKTLKSLVYIDEVLGNNDPWIYLRLFYTETSLGWTSADFAYRNMPLVFGLAILSAFACLVAVRRSVLGYAYLDNATVFVICVICVPAFTALLYMIGRYTLMPLKGVAKMNSNGCCTQALVFPRQQVDGLVQYLRGRGHGQTDSMIEEYADQTHLTRYALAPQQLQHVGLKSSRDNLEINARSTYSFWFEENDPTTLREEHNELLHDPDIQKILNRYG